MHEKFIKKNVMVGVFYEINSSFILPGEEFEFYEKDMQEND